MNILHCLDNSNIGGIQELVLNLYLHDKANHHDFWAADGTMAPIMREAGMMLWNGGPPQELQDTRFYQVVVGHTVGGWSHRDLFTWAKERGAKTIEVMHSNAKSPTPPELVDAFIGLNSIAVDMNRQMKHGATIYAVVDVDKFHMAENAQYIGRLSRLVEEKRPFDFVRIAERFPDEKFSLAGDGELYTRMLSSAPLNLFMPGMVRNFPAYYSTLRLFVFPTKDECCCVSVAMAQAAGVPVICQDLPSLRETTGGFAVFCNTPEEFAAQVGHFLNDGVPFYQMGGKGREWARSHFAPKIVVEQWQKVIDGVMRG